MSNRLKDIVERALAGDKVLIKFTDKYGVTSWLTIDQYAALQPHQYEGAYASLHSFDSSEVTEMGDLFFEED